MASLRVLWQQLCATPSAFILWADVHPGFIPQPVICHAFGVFYARMKGIGYADELVAFAFPVCVLFLPLRILNNKQNK